MRATSSVTFSAQVAETQWLWYDEAISRSTITKAQVFVTRLRENRR